MCCMWSKTETCTDAATVQQLSAYIQGPIVFKGDSWLIQSLLCISLQKRLSVFEMHFNISTGAFIYILKECSHDEILCFNSENR